MYFLMFVHGSNLEQKERRKASEKYGDAASKAYLSEIRAKYNEWKDANTALIGPKSIPDEHDREIIAKRVQLLEGYKAFLDQQKYAEHFDSRSDLHSTVLEEFLYYLFRDLVADFGNRALIGKTSAFKDIFFVPPSYKGMTKRPWSNIERKDHDFVIGVSIEATLKTTAKDALPQKANNNETETQLLDVPAVAIECKTYLDKAMLEGCSRAAEELKARNPNSIYIVVMEWLKLAEEVNLRKYKVDQIYVLRTDINIDRENRYLPDYKKHPIELEAVWHLYETVRKHLTTDWQTSFKEEGLKRGWLL